MKRVTPIRLLIITTLVYCPVVVLGATGKFAHAFEAFSVLASIVYLGYAEGKRSK